MKLDKLKMSLSATTKIKIVDKNSFWDDKV